MNQSQEAPPSGGAFSFLQPWRTKRHPLAGECGPTSRTTPAAGARASRVCGLVSTAVPYSSAVGVVSGAASGGVTVAIWVLKAQKRIHGLELRIQRQEDKAVQEPRFEKEMRDLRSFIADLFHELEQDLEPFKQAVTILADREGLNVTDYKRVNARLKPRAD